MEILTPTHVHAPVNTVANSSSRSESPDRGRSRRCTATQSSGSTTSPDTVETDVTAAYDGLRQAKKDMPSEYFFDQFAPVPDEYLLAVRASNDSFFPMQVSSTLLWERSGWFKNEMSKLSSSGPSTVSYTGLQSFYATDSSRGKMITVSFATREGLELYLNLISTGKLKFRPHLFINEKHSCSTMTDIVELYFFCLCLDDPVAAKFALEEIAKGLTQFLDDGTLDELTRSIWMKPADGIKKEMQALRRQFRNWGLRVFGSWLKGVNLWMEEEEKGPDDLVDMFTPFERDVIYDYWMDQE